GDSFALTLEMETELDLHDGSNSKKTWVVHHTMRQSTGPELTEWGRERKLFGWVGVAVPFQVRSASDYMQNYLTRMNRLQANGFGKDTSTGNFTGGLFTVLPLDKPSGHPAHLHGMFSITSDRASIHSR